MSGWERLKNLWKLSEHSSYVIMESMPSLAEDTYGDADAIFIPRNKRDPVKEIINHE